MNPNYMKKKNSGIWRCFVLLLLCITLLAGCGKTDTVSYIDPASDPAELESPKVGVGTGAVFDQVAEDTWDDAEISYFSSTIDAIPALTSGKIDCILDDKFVIEKYVQMYSNLKVMDKLLTDEDYGMIFQKNDAGAKLRDEFNEWLADAKEDGSLQAIIDCWTLGEEEDYPVLDPSVLPADNGTLKVNYFGEAYPMDFVYNNLPAGACSEIFYRFCEARGYGLQMDMVQGDSMIAGVISGKYDVSCSSWAITEERKESVNFSDSYYHGGTAVMIAADGKSGSGFFTKLKESFTKTFIKESRWKDFLGGIGVTLIVTILSLLAGTLLGFLIYLCYRKNPKAVKPVMDFLSWLIQGMPEVLLLLILFYIVFGKFDINGMWVAITGFSLIIFIEVYGMMQSSVMAIDKGQTEGALALGYTANETFFRIILPQAMVYIMPSYNSMVVSLIKSTAIVGYVAVKDLTKVSDIVRSRTFEAFFPLIATAIIYYLLAWILIRIVNFLQKHLMPIRRDPESILKGIRREEER